ncbi:TonB-dependent receptor [Opitutus sp. ER46]|uniref:TonB-dependent receptor n=1 Tax=Opitutus sp. ER46 TaxID=2161864 RepID=UPI000D31AA9B|nr:TonB-dependent receptor [Opitutus sp. ER46]PTX97679.1 hypothetical protein DB354_05185 [Opitutus sp. ER46]
MTTPQRCWLILALTLALPVAAQTAPATEPAKPAAAPNEAEPTIQLEAFTVTGSNIRRLDAETAMPISVIDRAELDARGATTMADLFETMGAAEISGITEINNGPQLARGDVASIDLRGLGSGSTLVLINGRRMAPHPISMAENGVPSLAANINVVPRTLVDRVEVLRDGASAVYGADAAAGVVNNYVSRSFVGAGITLRGSMTQHGGANETGVSAYEGFKKGKTHISVSADYYHRDALAASQREYSRYADQRTRPDMPAPWTGQPMVDAAGTTVRDNDFNNSNSVNQWGQWQRGFIQSNYLDFIGSRPDKNVGISTSTTPPAGVATMAKDGMFYLYPTADGGVSFKQSAPSKNIDSAENATYSNWNRWKMLIPATDRFQFSTFIDRPLTENVSAFGDLMFYSAYSRTGREPVNFKDSDDQGIYLPKENPYNPFGVRFYHPTGAPNADGTPRLVGTPADVTMPTGVSPGQNEGYGFKPRVTEVFSYAWRALGGVRGKLWDNWEWETALLASGAQTHEYEHFQVRESRLRYALARTDATAFNPFPVTFKIVNNQVVVDQKYTNPTALTDSLYDDEDRFGRTTLLMWDAKINGQLWQLFRGGNIGFASGVEVRYENYADKRAVYSGVNPPGSGASYPYLRENDNDFLALSMNIPISAHQTIYAAYAETALPFITPANRIPFVNSLEVSLAGRYENFSIFGDTLKPKASGIWKPVSWIKVRGSIAESFRAPNLVQTNISPLKRQFSSDDPYRYPVTALPEDSSMQRTSYRMGNQNLQPEEAQTWSSGVVVEVPKIRGLSLTFDYFKINQNKVIENLGAGASIDRDETYLDLATQAALASGKSIDQIDLGSGTAGYQGFDRVTRAAVTDEDRALFAAYNAKQTSNAAKRAVVGKIISVRDDYINLSGRDIQGYEFGVQYRTPKTPYGTFTFNGEATHYVVRKSQSEEGAIPLDELSRNGRAKWRANASLSWRKAPWGAGWFASYFGSFVDTSAATTEAVYRALGGPSYISTFNDNGIVKYYLRVDPYIQHNVWVSYNFKGKRFGWVSGTTMKVSLNNVFDTDPPLADEQYGYRTSAANPRGRQIAMELSKKF